MYTHTHIIRYYLCAPGKGEDMASASSMCVTGAGITVHTNPCERLSVRVAVARVALRQWCAYAVCVCHCL